MLEALKLIQSSCIELFALYTFIIYIIECPIPNRICFSMCLFFLIILIGIIYIQKFA